MTMAISKAVEAGSQAVICASTGNTSASAAAYAARAGLTCAVLVPTGKIALGKLAQALVHGAKLLEVDRQFRRLPAAGAGPVRELPRHAGQQRQSGPHRGPEDGRLRGVRRARRAARGALPSGRQRRQHHRVLAGLLRAGCRAGPGSSRPRMLGFQAAGSAPIVRGEMVTSPSTIATAIRIGNPASWQQAHRRPRRVRRRHPGRQRPRDPGRVQAARHARRASSSSRRAPRASPAS